ERIGFWHFNRFTQQAVLNVHPNRRNISKKGGFCPLLTVKMFSSAKFFSVLHLKFDKIYGIIFNFENAACSATSK
ncbi:hypothetical protein, partial [Heyndrickxia coagulans]|uniref:hypothetical protein n=1 Tax=Heyndrickxia coagulans TaxID=1398 RepID=UPI001C2C4664